MRDLISFTQSRASSALSSSTLTVAFGTPSISLNSNLNFVPPFLKCSFDNSGKSRAANTVQLLGRKRFSSIITSCEEVTTRWRGGYSLNFISSNVDVGTGLICSDELHNEHSTKIITTKGLVSSSYLQGNIESSYSSRTFDI
jgi:hypothetical protein